VVTVYRVMSYGVTEAHILNRLLSDYLTRIMGFLLDRDNLVGFGMPISSERGTLSGSVLIYALTCILDGNGVSSKYYLHIGKFIL